jgi:hypothetical protein
MVVVGIISVRFIFLTGLLLMLVKTVEHLIRLPIKTSVPGKAKREMAPQRYSAKVMVMFAERVGAIG